MRPAPTEAVQSGRALRFAHRLYALGPLVGLILLCIVGTLLNRDFATLDNLMNVLTRTSFIGIIAVGMTFVIISGGIDLSVGSLILNRTTFGRHVQAIGSNEQVARYAAIRVDTVKIVTYVLLGICVGVATVLYVPRLGSATPTTGLLWELEAIASVVVGGTALRGGEGGGIGTGIGAILLSVIGNILNLTSIISVDLN